MENPLTTFFVILALPVIFIAVITFPYGSYEECIKKFLSSIKKNLNEKTKRILKTLDSSKIEAYPLAEDITVLDEELMRSICNEIVCDQIGRALDENEKVSVMESYDLVDESVLVVFRYRRHDQENIKGSTRDKLISSVHIVKLTLNKLAQSVHIENMMSVDSDSVSHLNDPKGFIRDSITPFTGSCLKEDLIEVNTPVVKQMISD